MRYYVYVRYQLSDSFNSRYIVAQTIKPFNTVMRCQSQNADSAINLDVFVFFFFHFIFAPTSSLCLLYRRRIRPHSHDYVALYLVVIFSLSFLLRFYLFFVFYPPHLTSIDRQASRIFMVSIFRIG